MVMMTHQMTRCRANRNSQIKLGWLMSSCMLSTHDSTLGQHMNEKRCNTITSTKQGAAKPCVYLMGRSLFASTDCISLDDLYHWLGTRLIACHWLNQSWFYSMGQVVWSSAIHRWLPSIDDCHVLLGALLLKVIGETNIEIRTWMNDYIA